jgi:hypothetical protein
MLSQIAGKQDFFDRHHGQALLSPSGRCELNKSRGTAASEAQVTGVGCNRAGQGQRESEDLPDGFREAYPSAYHPPPFSSKEKREMILGAFLRQQGQEMFSVPMGAQRSVTVPLGHSNS